MSRTFARTVLLVAGLAALAPSAAPAGERIVWPAYILASDTRINLVGLSPWAADPANAADSLEYKCRLVVSVRDVRDNPIAGIPVVIVFSGCPDVRIAATQSYRSETVTCGVAAVQGYSTTNGTATFVVIGSLAGRAGHAPGCAQIYADGYVGPTLGVGAYDQDGIGGMSLADVGWIWADVASGQFQDRSDLDGSGAPGLADVAWAWSALSHPFTRSGSPLCP